MRVGSESICQQALIPFFLWFQVFEANGKNELTRDDQARRDGTPLSRTWLAPMTCGLPYTTPAPVFAPQRVAVAADLIYLPTMYTGI